MGKDKKKKKDKVSAATARRIKIESNALMDGFFGFPVPTAFLLSHAYSNMGYSTYSYSYVRPTYKLRCCFAFSFVPIRHRLSSVTRNQQVIGCLSN